MRKLCVEVLINEDTEELLNELQTVVHAKTSTYMLHEQLVSMIFQEYVDSNILDDEIEDGIDNLENEEESINVTLVMKIFTKSPTHVVVGMHVLMVM